MNAIFMTIIFVLCGLVVVFAVCFVGVVIIANMVAEYVETIDQGDV